MADTLAELINERARVWVKELGFEGCLTDSDELIKGSLLKIAENQLKREQEAPLRVMRMPGQQDLEPHLRNVDFSAFMAEPLLREGSLLLDRCLSERKEFEELHAKFFEACLQIQELIELNNITSDEEDTYQITVEIAKGELHSLVQEKKKIEDAIAGFDDFFAPSIGSPDVRIIEQKMAELVRSAMDSAYALAYNPGISFRKQQYMYRIENGVTTSQQIITCADRYAEQSEKYRGEKDISTLKIQLAQLQAIKVSLEGRIATAEKQVELKKSQLEENGFQRRRNEVARFTALRRGEELRNLGGALNFKQQMLSVKKRLENDLWAAALRLEKAAAGFKMLYGYDAFDLNNHEQFPNKFSEKGLYGQPIDLDELVYWAQVTNTWLAAFIDTQQQVTFSFSLKDLVKGAENFAKGIEERDGRTQAEWSFLLTPQDFYDRKNVRMRSFSLQVDCGAKPGSWNFQVTPPSIALREPSKQDHVGTLFLGKVNERTYAVIPESAAPPKLYNISPIGERHTNEGKWKIEVVSNSTAGTSIHDIANIDLHLTVALV